MPAFIGSFFSAIANITPLLALFFKIKTLGIIFKIVIFDILYSLFTTATNAFISKVYLAMGNIGLPCDIAWVLNDLKLTTILTIYLNIILSASSLKLIFNLASRVPK